MMVDYKRMYQIMFRAAEYAVRQMEQGELETAIYAIKLAQLACENIYIETAED